MKLTKAQKKQLKDHDWDIVEAESGQNCTWLTLEPKDGEIFHFATELFGLTGDGDIALLVVGTREEFENEDN
jgi:hypothetical protein